MRVKLYRSDLNEIIYEKNYKELVFLEDGIQEVSSNRKNLMGESTFREIFLEGVHIYIKHSLTNIESLDIKCEFDQDVIELFFNLKGKAGGTILSSDQSMYFDEMRHNLVYCKAASTRIHMEPNRHSKVIGIRFDQAYFQRHGLLDCEVLKHFFKQQQYHDLCYSSDKHLSISSKLLSVLDEIEQCPYKGSVRRLFLESKVIELLILHLDMVHIDHEDCHHCGLKRSDMEKIYEAENILLLDLESVPTISQLAKKVGLNELKLKKGFKQVFNKAIYNYFLDHKLGLALKMLEEGELSVKEISEKVGYKYPQHFTNAFKKKYNYLPKDVRNIYQ